MIKCIAIDDEPLALDLIEDFCKDVPFLKFEKSFTQTSLATEYLRDWPVDLIFLDINMPDMNGIDFFKSMDQDCMVIFTTAHSEYAMESYNLDAIDYLLKPILRRRFVHACEKARDHFEYLNTKEKYANNFLFVRSEYAMTKIPFGDILYLETLDDYIKIHQLAKKPVITHMSMKKMMERLPQNDFVRIHRSFVVPLNKIESVRGKSVSLGVVDLPIGTSFERSFNTAYMRDSF